MMTSGKGDRRIAGALACLSLALVAGCAGPHSISRERITRATRLLAMGDASIALEEVRRAVERAPRDIEIHWLYQDLLLASGRRSDAIDEYFDRLRRSPGDRDLPILFGRIGARSEEKVEGLYRLLRREERERWVRLALAEASLDRGDPKGAERWIHQGAGTPEGRAALPIHLVSALRSGRLEEAMELAEACLSTEEMRPPPSAALIYAHLLAGDVRRALQVGRRIHPRDDRPETFRALGIAHLRARSYLGAIQGFRQSEEAGRRVDPSLEFLAYHGAIQALLGMGRLTQVGEVADEAIRKFPRSGILLGLKAILLERLGNGEAALQTMRMAVDLSPTSGDLARRARLLFVERGHPGEAHRVWTGGIPPGMALSPENRLSGRFQDLLRWSEEAERQPGEPGVATSLARAYLRAGWISEAIAQYRRALRLGETEEGIDGGLQAALGFRRVLRSFQGYLREPSDLHPSIEEVAKILAGLIKKETGEVVATEGPIDSYLFFGKEFNPLVSPKAPLIQYFLRFNHYLDIREVGGKVECRVMELVSWRDEEEEIFGCTYRWQRITTDRGPIRYPSEGAHRVAGSASWSGKGLTVDLEIIRSTLFPSDGAFPSPRAGKTPSLGRGRQEVRFSPGLRDRLIRGALEEAGSIPALLALEEENIAQHELGHIVDFAGLVPWGSHPLRHLGILFGHLFRAGAISSRYQMVAETFALARSPYPKLAVVTSLDWLRAEEARSDYHLLLFGDDPVARGIYLRTSRTILGRIVEEVAGDLEAYPALDPARTILDQFDRLRDDEIRRIAWKIYDEVGGRR